LPLKTQEEKNLLNNECVQVRKLLDGGFGRKLEMLFFGLLRHRVGMTEDEMDLEGIFVKM